MNQKAEISITGCHSGVGERRNEHEMEKSKEILNTKTISNILSRVKKKGQTDRLFAVAPLMFNRTERREREREERGRERERVLCPGIVSSCVMISCCVVLSLPFLFNFPLLTLPPSSRHVPR
jgi:hypothetical protein